MEMEKKLYDACLKGDVQMLEALMREDELSLARISLSSCFNQTPLHLACMLGHYDLAKSLISYKPDFVSRLDSQGRSPLHLASANGYANIVQLLLEHDRTICGVFDEDGRTPLHLAVMNGHHECVSQLIKVSHDCGREWKILHLCVMYNRLNVLILVLESNEKNIVQELSNIKDDKGNTILHFATGLRRMQMIKYLLKNTSQTLDVNALNGDGRTALDIIEQMPRDAQTVEIKEILISAGALNLRAKEIKPATTTTIQQATALPKPDNDSKRVNKKKGIFRKTVEKSDESLLIAATVIAAMAYQAAISPPGGIASVEDATAAYPPVFDQPNYLSISDSLLAYFNKNLSDRFWIFNTISFLAALSVIFLYTSGGSPKRRFFIWLIRLSMWITLTSMAVAYVIAVVAVTPAAASYEEFMKSDTLVALSYGITAWVGLLVLSTLVLVYLFLSYIVRTIVKTIARPFRKKYTSPDAIPTSNADIV